MEINLGMLIGIFFMATATQYIVRVPKSIIRAVCKSFLNSEGKKANSLLAPFFSLGIAIALCLLSGLDIFTAVGYPLSDIIVARVFTGALASLGAGLLYALITDYRDYRDKLAIEKATTVSFETPHAEQGEISTATKR
jgi:hypothetical protein